MEIKEYIELYRNDTDLQNHEGARMADAMCGIIQAKDEVKTERLIDLLDTAISVITDYHHLHSMMK